MYEPFAVPPISHDSHLFGLLIGLCGIGNTVLINRFRKDAEAAGNLPCETASLAQLTPQPPSLRDEQPPHRPNHSTSLPTLLGERDGEAQPRMALADEMDEMDGMDTMDTMDAMDYTPHLSETSIQSISSIKSTDRAP